MRTRTMLIVLMIVVGGGVAVPWLNMAEGELHLIPCGYQGPILIVFNQEDGQPEKYIEKIRAYEVPANGILKTRFSPNIGWIPSLKYRYKCPGRTSEVPSYDNPSAISSETIQIIGVENGVITGPKSNRNYHYQMYIVGKYADIDSLSKIAEQMVMGDIEDR